MPDESPKFGLLRYRRIKGNDGPDGEREIKVAYRGDFPSLSDGLTTLNRSAREVVAINAAGEKRTLKGTNGGVDV